MEKHLKKSMLRLKNSTIRKGKKHGKKKQLGKSYAKSTEFFQQNTMCETTLHPSRYFA